MKKLDLHGLTHYEAKETVDLFLNGMIFSAYRNKRSMDPVKIITGNSDAMKNIVKTIANELKLNVCDFGNGELIVEEFLI